MTTSQLFTTTGVPERTMTYRLGRLRSGGLVESARPYVSSGSAPLHWWLTPKGISVVSGEPTSRREGSCRPKPMFLAHTAAISALWTTLANVGPSVGLDVVGWKRDEQGWEDWSNDRAGGRITPDAVATFSVDGFEIDVFVEVDLATMTHKRLRDKAFRYMSYAESGCWRRNHASCPSLLFLTTSEQRVTTFLTGVEALRGKTKAGHYEFRNALLVVACQFVNDPETAITESVWRDKPDGDDYSFAELLLPHVEDQREQIAIAKTEAEEEERTAPLRALDSMRYLTHKVGKAGEWSPERTRRGEAMKFFFDDLDAFGEAEDWAMEHREFMCDLLAWYERVHALGEYDPHPPLPQGLHEQVVALTQNVREAQRERIHNATHAQELGEPMIKSLTKRLDDGEILIEKDFEFIDKPRRYEDLQQQAYGKYLESRSDSLRYELSRRTRRQRRRFDETAWLNDYDANNLLICPTCGIKYTKNHETGRICNACRTHRPHLTPLGEYLGLPGEFKRTTNRYERRD